jgi:cholesterol transport system auxiliary component
MNGPFQVEYYADVEWTDTAPAMVQLLLIQSFNNSGRLRIVASTRQTLATDFLLLSNLRKFQVKNNAAGRSKRRSYSKRRCCACLAASRSPRRASRNRRRLRRRRSTR